jgi:hypothetical protein
MSVLILLIVIAAVVLFFMLRSGENLRFETCADPHRVVMAAVGIVASKRRWQTMDQSDRGASFRYHKQPNPIVAIALLLFLVIPGIVYLVLASKRESLILTIDPATPGIAVVQVTLERIPRQVRRTRAAAAGLARARRPGQRRGRSAWEFVGLIPTCW